MDSGFGWLPSPSSHIAVAYWEVDGRGEVGKV